MKGKRVVVTGGAGFIGLNLVDELCADNEVVVVDDLSTGSIGNIARLADSGEIRFVKGDICERGCLKEAFSGADYVFHLAADVSVPGSVENPEKTNRVNIGGTLNVFIEARDAGVKKVVFSSSAAIYGNDPTLPKREDMTPLPESPYAISKITGEYYREAFSNLYGLASASLRYFNVYGPRQNPNSQYAAAVPRFIDRALTGRSITVYGDGDQTRDFVFVKDVARANILAAESDMTGTFNIAGGANVTINELAREIIKIAGEVPIEYEPARPGDVRHSCASAEKAKETLGFRPKCSVAQGLRETAE